VTTVADRDQRNVAGKTARKRATVTNDAGPRPCAGPASLRDRARAGSATFGLMGLFSHHHARDAYDQVYGGGRPRHEVTHELLAGAAAFEAMRMYEHHREREGIPVRHELAKELLAGFVGAEI
jgi:hypothetical protein